MRGPYKTKPPQGSVAELILAFYRSQRYRDWAPATLRKNDPILRDLMFANGNRQVSDLRRRDIILMRDSLGDTPAAANNWLKCVSVLLDYAIDLEYVEINVARQHVDRLPPKHAGGFRQWREDEIDAYLAHWPLGSLAHRVMVLALSTGAARIDLVKLGWANIQGERIRYQREKTIRHEEPVWIVLPIMPALAEVLGTIPPGQMTFLETRDGHIRSEKGLTGDFARWVDGAGLLKPDAAGRFLSLHGLRKAVGRRLAQAGCSPHELMSWLGHRNIKSSMPYTAEYDREQSGESAAEKLAGAKPSNVTRIGRRE